MTGGASSSLPGPIDVSVVMPVRNGMPYLAQQLAALARQTYRGRWEVLISDNGTYQPDHVTGEMLKDVTVIGRVVWGGGAI